MSEPKTSCEDCRWWGAERAHDKHWPLGTCRTGAPIVGEAQALIYSDPDHPERAGPIVKRGAWVWTAFDDWCGHYDSKDEPHPF